MVFDLVQFALDEKHWRRSPYQMPEKFRELSPELWARMFRELRFEEFRSLDPMVRAVFYHSAAYAWSVFRMPLIITSMARDSGVHERLGAIDYDVDHKEQYGGLLTHMARDIVDEANRIFVYDPARPEMSVAVFELEGEAAEKFGPHDNHAHNQIFPDATARRGYEQ